MGWKFKWFSSFASDFNFDYQASFAEEDRAKGKLLYNFEMTEIPVEDLPGMSVFFKDEAGEIFHTYSSYSRGLDPMIGTYQWLDLTPKGRDEEGLAQSMACGIRMIRELAKPGSSKSGQPDFGCHR